MSVVLRLTDGEGHRKLELEPTGDGWRLVLLEEDEDFHGSTSAALSHEDMRAIINHVADSYEMAPVGGVRVWGLTAEQERKLAAPLLAFGYDDTRIQQLLEKAATVVWNYQALLDCFAGKDEANLINGTLYFREPGKDCE